MPRISTASHHPGRPRSHRVNLPGRFDRAGRGASSEPAACAELGEYLHDEVGQWLALALLQLNGIPSASPVAERALRDLRHSLEQAALAIRDATQRCSAAVDAPSLLVAIEQSLASSPWAGRPLSTQLSPALSTLEPRQVPHAPRIIRELAANAHRHARATAIQVRAWRRGAVLRIQVRDNGVGFDASEDHASYGLGSVRRQVMAEGGRLRLHAPAGRGTRIDVELPLRDIRSVRDGDSSCLAGESSCPA